MSTTTTTKYQFLEAGESPARVTAFAYAKLGMSESELVERAERARSFYAANGRASDDARAIYAAILDLFGNAADHVASLAKSTRAAESTAWATVANVFVPTHVGRIANLFARSLASIHDLFVSFHTGAANVGRPVDLDVRLSILTAFAPYLSGDVDTVEWEFDVATYAAARMACVRALASIGVRLSRSSGRGSFDPESRTYTLTRA